MVFGFYFCPSSEQGSLKLEARKVEYVLNFNHIDTAFRNSRKLSELLLRRLDCL